MKPHKSEQNKKETSRIEAFSDGVFAIAITLLVLELITTLDPASGQGLIETGLEHWRSFVAFTIGFITIMVCWINHHIALEYVQKVDTRFMWVNGFLLFLVTLTPFPTAILAQYLETESQIALSVFGFNYFLISIAADAICSYAYNHHLIEEKDRQFYSAYKFIYRYATFYLLIAFLLTFISIIIPIVLYVILFVVFAAPKEFTNRINNFRSRKKK